MKQTKSDKTFSEMLSELNSVLIHLERYSELIPDNKAWDNKAQSLDNQFMRIRDVIKKATSKKSETSKLIEVLNNSITSDYVTTKTDLIHFICMHLEIDIKHITNLHI